MSRRIATAIAAIGITTVGAFLLISPTLADRECFGGLCQVPAVAEPPPEPQASATPQPVTAEPQAARFAAPAPARQPAADTALKPALPVAAGLPKPALPPELPAPAVAVSPKSVPAKPSWVARQTPAPAPERPYAEPSAPPETPVPVAASEVAPNYVVQQAPAYAPPAAGVVVVSAPTIYGDEGVTVVHPGSSWQLCQTDRLAVGQHQVCGPGSYHPYGANGYRPLGSYRAYRLAPTYVYAPSARIIAVDNAN